MRALHQVLGPLPAIVAIGACACGGGPIRHCGANLVGGVDTVLPVDLYIPGCAPSPAAIAAGVHAVLARCGDASPADQAGWSATPASTDPVGSVGWATYVDHGCADRPFDQGQTVTDRVDGTLTDARRLHLLAEQGVVREVQPRYDRWDSAMVQTVLANDWTNGTPVLERGDGRGGFAHALGYCQALEALLAVAPPPRARFLRVVWSELQRMVSHFLWLERLTEGTPLAATTPLLRRHRQTVMDLLEATAGNRVIVGACSVGGTRRDLSPEQTRLVLATLAGLQAEQRELLAYLRHDRGVSAFAVGRGVLSRERCLALGAVGPVARASGVVADARLSGYAAYGDLGFAPLVEQAGDVQPACSC